jgi:hypothetical protein
MKNRSLGVVRRIIGCAVLLAAITLAADIARGASPSLSLQTTGGTPTNIASVSQGTSVVSLNLLLNSGGVTTDGLQLHFVTSPVGVLPFGGTPLSILNTPFTSSDVQSSPTAGAIAQNSAAGKTALFKFSANDYPAVNGPIATYQFNPSSLSAGVYTITPVGEAFSSSALNGSTNTFATPASFTLTVLTPEPATAWLALGVLAVLVLRRPLTFSPVSVR